MLPVETLLKSAFVNRPKMLPHLPRLWSPRMVNWFVSFGRVLLRTKLPCGRLAFGDGKNFARARLASRENLDCGMVLFGKGNPVCGSVMVVVNRPANWSAVGTLLKLWKPLRM